MRNSVNAIVQDGCIHSSYPSGFQATVYVIFMLLTNNYLPALVQPHKKARPTPTQTRQIDFCSVEYLTAGLTTWVQPMSCLFYKRKCGWVVNWRSEQPVSEAAQLNIRVVSEGRRRRRRRRGMMTVAQNTAAECPTHRRICRTKQNDT